jgi:hypothetical protein
MASVWVRWRISTGDYSEITINDVIGEAARALNQGPCEARGDRHNERMYLVTTNRGPYILCRRCCKLLGLPC